MRLLLWPHICVCCCVCVCMCVYLYMHVFYVSCACVRVSMYVRVLVCLLFTLCSDIGYWQHHWGRKQRGLCTDSIHTNRPQPNALYPSNILSLFLSLIVSSTCVLPSSGVPAWPPHLPLLPDPPVARPLLPCHCAYSVLQDLRSVDTRHWQDHPPLRHSKGQGTRWVAENQKLQPTYINSKHVHAFMHTHIRQSHTHTQ